MRVRHQTHSHLFLSSQLKASQPLRRLSGHALERDTRSYRLLELHLGSEDALSTRQLGAQVRERLLPLIESNDKAVLDFEGVSVVSNSFADECLAKLLLVMPFEELKRRTTFASVNDFARRNIAIAFRRRMAQI